MMPRVRPGCETGIYYVILAGIGWDVDWHDLKDFVRANSSGPLIDVDYAEVYKNGGGGYVRLLGLSNFRKAFNLLNGATIKNHTIIADGRNETMEATILDSSAGVGDSDVHSQSQDYLPPGHNQMLSPMQPVFPSNQHTSEWASQTPSPLTNVPLFPTPYSQVQYTQPPSLNYSFGTGFQIQPTVTYYPVNIPGLVAVNSISIQHPIPSPLSDMQSSTPLSSPLPENYLSQHQHQKQQQQQQQPHQQHQPHQVSTSMIEIEARKIIITHLSRTASEPELYDLLSSVLHNCSTEYTKDRSINSIELPQHSDGSPKGHAFILFETYSIAKAIVDNLDGFIFHGRPLKIRFTKEGAEPSNRQSASTGSTNLSEYDSSNRKTASFSTAHAHIKHSSSRDGSGKKHHSSSTSSHTGSRQAHSKSLKSKTMDKMVESPPNREICATPVVADGSYGGRSQTHSGRHRR